MHGKRSFNGPITSLIKCTKLPPKINLSKLLSTDFQNNGTRVSVPSRLLLSTGCPSLLRIVAMIFLKMFTICCDLCKKPIFIALSRFPLFNQYKLLKNLFPLDYYPKIYNLKTKGNDRE